MALTSMQIQKIKKQTPKTRPIIMNGNSNNGIIAIMV
jgi:hypothetical protein